MTDRVAGSRAPVDRSDAATASDTAVWIRRHPAAALALLLLGTTLILRAFSFTSAGLDWDESLYIVIGQRWLHGDVPYLGIWDQHPMGLPAFFAATQWLVSDGLMAARLASFVAVLGTAILLGRFLARFADETLAGMLAGLLYLFYMSRPEGLAANTEVFNNLVVTAASFLLFAEMSRPARMVRAGRVLAASLLFGVGLQIKYVILPEAAMLCGALLIWLRREGAGWGRILGLAAIEAAGGLLPTIGATLYFWQAGALEPYLDANLRANMIYLGDPLSSGLALLRLRWGLLPIAGLLPWPLVLAFLWRDGATRRRFGPLGLWLTIWLAAAAIDVVWPMKLWKHYFNALIPPLCAIAGLATVLLVRRMGSRQRRWLVAAVVVTLLPAVGSLIKHARESRTIARMNVPRALADRIRQEGTNGHDIYAFNYDPLVYAYSDAVPPTRFVLGIALAEFSKYSGEQTTGEIARVLAAPPRWIIVAEPSPYDYPAEVRRGLDAALQRYRLAAEYPELDYIQPPITVRLYRLAGIEP